MEHINDKFLMTECTAGSELLLAKGLPINDVCKVVKTYQANYIYVKEKYGAKKSKKLTFIKHIELFTSACNILIDKAEK